MDMSNRRRIVILGKTGAGKSSLANTIFEEKKFNIGHSLNSDTRTCQADNKSVNGRNITLIDTPGFFDTARSEEEMKSEIVRCITDCAPGPHAFLIVLKVERYTEHEQAVVTKIIEYFSEDVFKYATVLFTHGDQLEEGQTIDEYIKSSESVSDLVKKCGGRCHVIDNKYWKNNQQDEYRSNQFQVKELLKTIEQMIEANGGGCYTNEMLQAVGERIILEEELIRQSPGNMSEEEIRKKAKDSVFKWLWIKLADITTVKLFGAFLGKVLMVGPVVSALENVLALGKLALCGAEETETGGGEKTETGGGEKTETGGAEETETGGAAETETGGAAETETGGAAETYIVAVIKAITAGVGAVAGGLPGYNAAEGADTPQEAAERPAMVVIDGSKQ